MSGKFFSRTLSFVLAAVLVPSVAEAQVTATWNGDGDGVSYSDPDNWDIDLVPINGLNGPDSYIVAIPGSQNVFFDVPGAGHQVFQLSLGSSSDFRVNSGRDIEVQDEASILGRVIADGGTFLAPSNASLFPGNAARATVLDSGQLTFAATSYSSTGLASSSQTLFLADGSGSVLDLSSLESINAGWNDGTGAVRVHTIQASNGATIDLSNVASMESPDRGEDRLDIVVGVDSQIDLSGLTTLVSDSSGDTRFVINRPDYSLPSLEDARHTQFLPAAGTMLNLGALMNHSSGSYTIPDGAVVNAPQLESLTSVSLTIEQGGTFSAPNLTNISGSVVSVTPTTTFVSGALTSIDNARLRVREGETFGVSTGDVVATSYSSTGLASSSQTLFLADGSGSVLDLSSLESINAGWNDGTGAVRVHTIQASNGATIDLSGVASINGPSRGEDRIDIRVEGASMMDLSSLTTVTNQSAGQTRLIVGDGSTLKLGSIVSTDNLQIIVSDVGSTVDFAGSLTHNSGAFSVGTGATVEIGGNLSHSFTAESSFVADSGVVQFDGTGAQQFDVAGTDSGANAFTSGNFGIGQLVIGTTTQRTSVELIEVVDNGNRGINSEPEALYLYGLGGPAGLRIFNNSALVLNGLNVYAHDPLSGDQVHLNSLFGPGELRIPFDDGFLQLVPLDFQWDNNAGGDFNLGGNWSDGLVPLGSDAAIWNLGSVNGYNVQFGTNVATDSAIINSDNVTYQLGGFTYTLAAVNATTGLVVGQNATDNSRLTVAGGMLVTRNARIAAEGGSQGTLTVAADGMLQVDEQLIAGGGQGTLLVEQGGIAQIDGGLSLLAAGRLAGSGQVIGDVDNQAGMISPGQLPGSQTPGQLQVVGNVVQGVDAALEIELGGTDNSDLNNPEYDVLTVDGALMLDGSLAVSLDDLGGGLFAPQDGDLFEIATATSGIDGEFSEFSVPEVAGLTWLLGIGSDSVVLTLTDTPSDFVGNTDIDGGYFLAWQLGFGTVGGATVADGDTNADGNVDGVDLDNWRAQYGFQVIVNTPEINAVPEPSAMLLGLLLTATVATQRWARCPLAPRED